MIPETSGDLAGLIEEAYRQVGEVKELVGGLDPTALRWRPDPTRWSVAGHLAHLVIVNAPYQEAIASTVEDARTRGRPVGDGPYRHPRVTTWFARSMEPPPRRRMKTFRSMVPDPEADAEKALDRLTQQMGELPVLVERSRGLDLGRARFGSPFFPLLRFSLGTGFELILAHNRRHIWLAREVMSAPGFPGHGREGRQG